MRAAKAEPADNEVKVHPDWASLRPEVTPELLDGIVQRIVAQFHPHRIWLFGSYAYGHPTIDSDLDLLVVMNSEESIVARMRRVSAVAEVPFLPMDVLVRTPDEMAERLAMGDPLILEVINRGVILYDIGGRVGGKG